MKRKHPIPGVDEAALAALAEQFPSGSLRTAAPPSQDNAPLPRVDQEIRGLQSLAAAAAGAPQRKAPGNIGLSGGERILLAGKRVD